jgi:putative lipoprotein
MYPAAMILGRRTCAVCAFTVAAACGRAPAPAPAEAPPVAVSPAADGSTAPPTTTRFGCENDVTVLATFTGTSVALALPGRTITLPQAPAASGARYTDGATTFWNKGTEAMLDLDGLMHTCRVLRDPWQEARDRGIDFRALGQEPGWFLEIDRERWMRLLYDYAEREATTPVPLPVTKDGTTTYDAVTEAHRLRVVIDDRPCSDVMSGETFDRAVTVTIDGRTLLGCGRQLSP